MELEQDSEIKLAKNGNHEAFINLIKPLELQMYSIAKAILRHDEDCADAMQEAILKAYKSLPGGGVSHHHYPALFSGFTFTTNCGNARFERRCC
ncbi:hypothetical protein [Paenibacillus glucanolyticus]|uniref:hypothetical protein n=1 Tax=Paenibacillus glucanolyticus TaxID=59843 RepID=UPI0030EF169F